MPTHGRFGWHELLTTDPAVTAAFYGRFTNWTTAPFPGQEGYTLWQVGETPVAGFMALPDPLRESGIPPAWVSYLLVDDAEETIRRATEMGATRVVGPHHVPSVGVYGLLTDPQGAAFGILQEEAPGAPTEEPSVGEFSWHELVTTDWRHAWGFYVAVFGWQEAGEMDMGEYGIYKMFGHGGPPRGGIYTKLDDMPAPPHWLPYVKVPNADRAAERVRGAGGQVVNGPMDVPGDSGDRIAQCVDPQGVMFAVHSVAAVVAAPEPAPTPPPAPEPAPQPVPPAKSGRKKAAPAKKKATKQKSARKKAVKRVTKRPVKKQAGRKKKR